MTTLRSLLWPCATSLSLLAQGSYGAERAAAIQAVEAGDYAALESLFTHSIGSFAQQDLVDLEKTLAKQVKEKSFHPDLYQEPVVLENPTGYKEEMQGLYEKQFWTLMVLWAHNTNQLTSTAPSLQEQSEAVAKQYPAKAIHDLIQSQAQRRAALEQHRQWSRVHKWMNRAIGGARKGQIAVAITREASDKAELLKQQKAAEVPYYLYQLLSEKRVYFFQGEEKKYKFVTLLKPFVVENLFSKEDTTRQGAFDELVTQCEAHYLSSTCERLREKDLYKKRGAPMEATPQAAPVSVVVAASTHEQPASSSTPVESRIAASSTVEEVRPRPIPQQRKRQLPSVPVQPTASVVFEVPPPPALTSSMMMSTDLDTIFEISEERRDCEHDIDARSAGSDSLAEAETGTANASVDEEAQLPGQDPVTILTAALTGQGHPGGGNGLSTSDW